MFTWTSTCRRCQEETKLVGKQNIFRDFIMVGNGNLHDKVGNVFLSQQNSSKWIWTTMLSRTSEQQTVRQSRKNGLFSTLIVSAKPWQSWECETSADDLLLGQHHKHANLPANLWLIHYYTASLQGFTLVHVNIFCFHVTDTLFTACLQQMRRLSSCRWDEALLWAWSGEPKHSLALMELQHKPCHVLFTVPLCTAQLCQDRHHSPASSQVIFSL